LLGGNITKISSIANVILLLILFVNGEITVGLFIAMSGLMFRDVYQDLDAFPDFLNGPDIISTRTNSPKNFSICPMARRER